MSPCHVEVQQSAIREIVGNKMMMQLARNNHMENNTLKQFASASNPDRDYPKPDKYWSKITISIDLLVFVGELRSGFFSRWDT